jgi:hypothetical protein
VIRYGNWQVQFLLVVLAMSIVAIAQAPPKDDNSGSFIEDRLQTASRADAEQPHWIAPLFTLTPRLLEQLRFDVARQTKSGYITANYGGGKGLELIPTERTEITVSTPSYVAHEKPGVQDGFGDMSFLFKYRIAAGNDEHGNYIVSAFIGGSVPTGSHSNGAPGAIATPTLALGKGWGNFDFQTTVGVAIPTSHIDTLGTPLAHNIAFQYRLLGKFWPEMELNSTFWLNGTQAGNKQLFLSPGLVVGKFHLRKRLGLTVGAGIQIPVTEFHAQDRNLLVSVRFPF